jgi:hypothetical protein
LSISPPNDETTLSKIKNKKTNTKTSRKNLKLKIKNKIEGVARFRKIKIKFLFIRKKSIVLIKIESVRFL